MHENRGLASFRNRRALVPASDSQATKRLPAGKYAAVGQNCRAGESSTRHASPSGCPERVNSRAYTAVGDSAPPSREASATIATRSAEAASATEMLPFPSG